MVHWYTLYHRILEVLHSVVMLKVYPHFKKFSWNQFTVYPFCKNVFLTKFLHKNRGGKIIKFPHCVLQPRFCLKNSVKWLFTKKSLIKLIDLTKKVHVSECLVTVILDPQHLRKSYVKTTDTILLQCGKLL